MRQDDLILEGVRAGELESLQALAQGQARSSGPDIVPLHAKGWVEVIGGDVVITLTGRALLDRQQAGFR